MSQSAFHEATVLGLTPCQQQLRVKLDQDGRELVLDTDNPNDTTLALATTRVRLAITAIGVVLDKILPHPTGVLAPTTPRGA